MLEESQRRPFLKCVVSIGALPKRPSLFDCLGGGSISLLYQRSMETIHLKKGLPSVFYIAALYFSVAWIVKYDDLYRNPNMNNKDHRVG